MTASERIENVKHWLLLKQAWDRWKDGQPMLSLPEETQKYFERKAGQAVRKYVERYPRKFEHSAPPSSDQECWGILMEYLMRKRPKAALHLIDHIFESAFVSATKALEGRLMGTIGVEQAIEQLLNRWNTQVVLSAMGDYVRQLRPPPRGTDIRSTDEKTGESERTFGDTLSEKGGERWWGTEMEREEVEEIARETCTVYFGGVRAAFRLSVFLRGLRQNRLVTVSCAEPRVLAVAGVKTAVFAEGASLTLEGLTLALRARGAIAELDPPARKHATLTATRELTDAAEEWFFSGQFLEDCLREQLSSPRAPADTEETFPSKAEALAVLIRDRLREAGKILAENEMARVFLKLSTP